MARSPGLASDCAESVTGDVHPQVMGGWHGLCQTGQEPANSQRIFLVIYEQHPDP
ncbi:hypothetical protein [Nitrosospira multiformis]|uniref:hypothetical protein n=1 Tax=Nitrosospira multiformis TaxID=1231 RepID=UPI001C40ADE7|nr:hypothetical protein [Nitrosospira multiformis]